MSKRENVKELLWKAIITKQDAFREKYHDIPRILLVQTKLKEILEELIAERGKYLPFVNTVKLNLCDMDVYYSVAINGVEVF